MRPALLVSATLALIVLGAAAASVSGPDPARDDGGISLPALSRCAGIAGTEMREADPAFGLLMLDGAPWLALQRDHEAVLLTGSGTLKRRNGRMVPFRFACALDGRGRAMMFRVSLVEPDARKVEPLPPSRLVTGRAALDTKEKLPRGAELRLQLLDVAREGAAEILAEQLVRSGWEVPIPFALRLPAELTTDGRKLVLAARVTVARQTVFLMKPMEIASEALARPLTLRLQAVKP